MKNEKKYLKHLFYLTVLFLFCFQIVKAQPTCSANFDPNETCGWEIQSAEFIFLGRVFYDAAKDRFPATENSGDIDYNYHFKKVPAGQYMLMLSITVDPSKPNHTIYYPGTFIEEKAFVINVEAGKTSNIEFSLPDLPEN